MPEKEACRRRRGAARCRRDKFGRRAELEFLPKVFHAWTLEGLKMFLSCRAELKCRRRRRLQKAAFARQKRAGELVLLYVITSMEFTF